MEANTSNEDTAANTGDKTSENSTCADNQTLDQLKPSSTPVPQAEPIVQPSVEQVTNAENMDFSLDTDLQTVEDGQEGIEKTDQLLVANPAVSNEEVCKQSVNSYITVNSS